MRNDNLFDQIRDHQRNWAKSRGILLNINDRTIRRDDNFFLPLNQNELKQYTNFGVKVTGTETSPGEIQSIYSSAALVYNIFGYWCICNPDRIADLCGLKSSQTEISFETKHSTGKGLAELDVEIRGTDAPPLCIESKYTEFYRHKVKPINLRKAYYQDDCQLWGKVALTNCEDLIRWIVSVDKCDGSYERLDILQLLKHVLALKKEYECSFTLLYLWYEYPSPEADKHHEELDKFRRILLDDNIDFRDMTYQGLFEKILKEESAPADYKLYLAERYFY